MNTVKILKKEFTDTKGFIELAETEPYFINALRRTMMSEIPKLAIDEVIIYDNNSPLFDEIISHRLSLIPVPTDLKLLTFRDNCTCDGAGCANCTVRYTLSKEGEGTIYSGDLTPENKDWAIKEDKIPIVKLGKDQRIILEVEAILGRGKQHAKWQSVQCPGYHMYPKITIDEKQIKDIKEMMRDLPAGFAELKKNEIILSDPTTVTTLENHIDNHNLNDAITIKRDETHLLFHFETDGSLSAEAAFKEAISTMLEKYDEFNKAIKKL